MNKLIYSLIHGPLYEMGDKPTKPGKYKQCINDHIALKINARGKKISTQTVGSVSYEVLRKLFETRDGGYILAGTSKGQVSRDKQSNIGGGDFWVVKLKDKEKANKEKYKVEAVPNPAISYTNVIVTYAYKNGTATLYDLNGRYIQSVELTGEKTIPMDLGNLPQGIYLIEVKTDVNTSGVKVLKK